MIKVLCDQNPKKIKYITIKQNFLSLCDDAMFQELHYILLNTFLYGSVALLIASFFAYSKVLNFSLGAYLTFAVYVIWEAIQHGFSLTFWLMLIVFFVSLLLVHWLLVSLFPNEKQREQA